MVLLRAHFRFLCRFPYFACGYTRILRTGFRLGDAAEMCIIELVDYNENMLKETKKAAKKATRRAGKKAVKEEVAEVVAEAEAAPAAEAPAAEAEA